MLVSCLNEEMSPNDDPLCTGLTPLHLVCAFDQTHILKYYLSYGFQAVSKVVTTTKQSLMHTCAWFGSYSTLSLLIRNGVSTEEPNGKGQLPLHLASIKGNYICIQNLLKEMLDPNLGDSDGNTAVHLAVMHDKMKSVEELLKFDTVRR